MSKDKYASLPQRRETLTAEDRKTVRQKAMLGLSIGGIMFCVLVYIAWQAMGMGFAGPSGAVMLGPGQIVGGFFALILIFILVVLGRYLLRLWRDLNLETKIVYSGNVTSKRWYTTGNKSTTWHFCVSLNNVEFEMERESYELVDEGDQADLHCTTPGEVFRIVRVAEAKRRSKKDDNKIEFRIGGIDHTFKVDSDAFGRYVAFGGAAFTILVFMLGATGYWWFACTPPAPLLFFGKPVAMEVTESRLEQNKTNKNLFRPFIRVSPPPMIRADESDNDAEPPTRKKFALQAFRGENIDSDKTTAQQALVDYPVGKIFDAYAFSATEGTFYAVKYARTTIVAAAAILLIGVGCIVFAGYRIFKN